MTEPTEISPSEQVETYLAELRQAVENARSLQQQAETAQAAAVVALAAAETARIEAEQQRDSARSAKDATETLRVETKGSKDKAGTAATAAEAARANAEKARDEAMNAKTSGDSTLTQISQAYEVIDQVRKETEVAKGVTLEARDTAFQTKTDVEAAHARVEIALTTAEQAASKADASARTAADSQILAKSEADNAQAEAVRAARAHNLSTTAGLAGAFNEKAIAAAGRERVWALALLLALTAAVGIGWFRYADLLLLLQSKPDPNVLLSNVVLTLFGVGAPVWLAWVSTRMISQNMALAEDYAYKAALAKAYVGFREEAKALGDPIFEQRLFAAAITQLDANPVRLLSASHPGSPLQDLLQQPFIQDALRDETFKQKMIDWLRATFRSRTSAPMPSSVATSTPKASLGE